MELNIRFNLVNLMLINMHEETIVVNIQKNLGKIYCCKYVQIGVVIDFNNLVLSLVSTVCIEGDWC